MRAILVLLLLLLATPAAALRVVVVSDLNGSYGSTEYGKDVYAAVEAIISIGPDLVISTGDMVAGQRRPHLTEPEIRAMWRGFHAVVSDPLAEAGIPFLVTPGNHDASAYGGFEREREIFREEWRTRTPPWPVTGNWPLQYAVDVEGIRFTSLDVTTVGSFSVGQTEDLKQLFEGAGQVLFNVQFKRHGICANRIRQFARLLHVPPSDQNWDVLCRKRNANALPKVAVPAKD